MKREYPPRPIVGVGVVLLEGDAVLLARRGKAPGKGLWSLPGGAVELGETLAEALARETREELSVEIEIGGLVDVYDRIFPDSENRIRYHYVLVDYWGRIVSGSPKAGSDVSEVGWFPTQGLASVNVGLKLKEAVAGAVRLRALQNKNKERTRDRG